MPFITAENAAELGRKSGEVRRNKPVSFLVPVPNSQTIIEPDIARTVIELLKIVTEQIARTRELLNDDDYGYCEHCKRSGVEPNHRAQLLKALDNLIERKAKLLGIPDPGSYKPSSKPTRPQHALVDPKPIDTPQQAAGNGEGKP